jgi:hypothetical protein
VEAEKAKRRISLSRRLCPPDSQRYKLLNRLPHPDNATPDFQEYPCDDFGEDPPYLLTKDHLTWRLLYPVTPLKGEQQRDIYSKQVFI